MSRQGIDFSKIRTLEIGCGTGTFSLTLNMLGANTTLLDADPEAIEAAKKCFSIYGLKADYITGDVTKPLPEALRAKFDFVISGGLAEHFTGDNRVFVIRWHRETLKDNGLAYIAVPNALSPYYRTVRAAMELTGQWTIENEVAFTPAELRKTASEAGFAASRVAALVETRRDIVSHALALGSVALKLLPSSLGASLKKMSVYSNLKRMEPAHRKHEIDLKRFISEKAESARRSPDARFLKKGLKDSLSSNIVLLGFNKK
jgi:SAM-dependent methyltransferase